MSNPSTYIGSTASIRLSTVNATSRHDARYAGMTREGHEPTRIARTVTRMDRGWWVTVVRAWHQENEKSGLVIRMINSNGDTTDTTRFASVDEAVAQLRRWLEDLEREVSPNRRKRDEHEIPVRRYPDAGPIRSD